MAEIQAAPWELLQKRMTWTQIGELRGKKILDFGSGNGITADHFAAENAVVAVEPDESALQNRSRDHVYTQIHGDMRALRGFAKDTFDVVLCHNVLEYAQEREQILSEFARIMKKGGLLSLLKHNRAGRVMQMVVLLDAFDHAARLLDGQDGQAQQFGTIRYYEDSDVTGWSDCFAVEQILGMRTFWDLQQNQEGQDDPFWQDRMLEMEMRVSDVEAFRSISFFHHMLLRRR